MDEKITLLLADDDQAVTDSLAPFLERAGFQVLIALGDRLPSIDGQAAAGFHLVFPRQMLDNIVTAPRQPGLPASRPNPPPFRFQTGEKYGAIQ